MIKLFINILFISEGVWLWQDGTEVAMPTDTWHAWYEGEPDNNQGVENCMVMTNFNFWSERKLMMDMAHWKDYNCDANPQEINGFVCESMLANND